MDAQNATPRSGAAVPPKRPVTKPVAPRLSSTVTRPTAASATRTSTGTATGTVTGATTNPSSLSKPPTRPITTSTIRKSTAATTAAGTTPGTVHRSRPSATSVEASDGESKRDGITARPKRMSLASGTLASGTPTERPSTTANRTVTATPVRRTTAISGTTARPTVRSPTAATKTAAAGHTRTSSTLSSRARPPSSASTRGPTTLADRRRLSTIPASPAVKSKETEGEDVEDGEQEHDQVPTEEEAASLDDIDEADGAEKDHGVVKPEAVSIGGEELAAVKAQLEAAQDENSTLKSDLAKATQAVEESIKAAEETSAGLERTTQTLEAKHNEAIEQLQEAHQSKIQEIDMLREEGIVSLTAKHKSEIDALKADGEEAASANLVELEALKAEVRSLKDTKDTLEAREGELEKTRDELKRKAKDVSQKDEQLGTLKAELELLQGGTKVSESDNEAAAAKDLEISSLKKEIEALTAKTNSAVEAVKADDNSAAELAKVKKDLETLQAEFTMTESMLEATRAELEANKARHSEAKNNAESKLVKVSEEHAAKVSKLEEAHNTKLSELEKLSQTSATKEDDLNAKLGSLDHANRELQAIIKSRDEESVKSQQTVAQLEQRLTAAEQARSDEAASSTAALTKIKGDHAKEVESIRSQLTAVRAQLDRAADTKDASESQAIKKANEEAKAVQRELDTAKSTHQARVTDLQRQVTEAGIALKAVRSAEAENRQLREQADAVARHQVDIKAQHTAEIESVRTELTKQTNEVVATLTAEHAKQLASQQKEIEASQAAALQSLKTEHAKAIRSLEEQSTSALKDLEGLETSNIALIEQVRSEAEKTRHSALEDQAEAHAGILRELETRLAARQNELATLKGTHEGSLTKLKSTHTSEKNSALAKLAADHEQKIDELTTEFKSSQYSALEALKRAHMEEASRTESQLKAVSDEYEATKLQLQGLKDVLHSVDNETKSKDEKHVQVLAKVQAELGQALDKLSQQATHATELESHHRSLLQQSEEAMLKKNEGVLIELKQAHNQSLESLRKELEKKHQSALEDMANNHTKAIDLLKHETSSRDSDLAKLKTEHAQALADMAASSKSGSEDVSAQLKFEHVKVLTDVRQSLQNQHKAATADLQASHATEIATKIREASLLVDQTKAEHKSVIDKMQSELEELRSIAKDTSQIDALKTQLNENKLSMERMQEAQAEMMSSITKEHEAELLQLNSQLSTLKSDAERPREDPKSEALNAQLIDAQRRHAELVTKHAQTIKAKDNEHQQALSKLSAEVVQLKAAATNSPASRGVEDAAGGEKLPADARRTIAELSEQYANAALEAENQRVIAEKVQRELRELKQSLLQTEYKASNSLASKKIRTKDLLKGLDSTAKTSPKAGLGASKWAQEDSEDAGSKTPPATASNDVSDGSVNLDGESSTGAKRSVAGQMAGIQESIRQLDEMSNDLLEENQSMAKTLSKVQSDGTIAMQKAQPEEDDP